MLNSTPDTKSSVIINAAFQTFMAYGFKRATMDDIARAAGMSRPALYLVYKNKQDIFRACIIKMTEDLTRRLDDLLNAPGTTEERAWRIFDAGIIEPHRLIGATQHGAELFALKSDIATDLFSNWMKVIEGAFARVLAEDQARGLVDLSASGLEPQEIAAVIVDATEGIKLRMTSMEALPQQLGALTKLIIGPLVIAK